MKPDECIRHQQRTERSLLHEIRRMIEAERPPKNDIRDEWERGAYDVCTALLKQLDKL